jgi:hypothetical protein
MLRSYARLRKQDSSTSRHRKAIALTTGLLKKWQCFDSNLSGHAAY